jgi:hypothetical protein
VIRCPAARADPIVGRLRQVVAHSPWLVHWAAVDEDCVSPDVVHGWGSGRGAFPES